VRLALVVTGGLHPSGREQVVPSLLALFERLARTHEVHAFVLRHLFEARTYRQRGFTVHDLGRPSAPFGLTRWAQQRALVKAMAAEGSFDLVHGFWADPAGLLATRAGRHFGIPAVLTCDSGEFVALPDIDYGSQRTPRGQAAVKEACSLASQVHVSTAFMAGLGSGHGVTPRVIPLGVARTGAAPPPRPGGLRLIQVATLSRVKNQASLIDAIALLARDMNVRLALVGEDTLESSLQERARSRGVADRIVFHGFVPNDELAPLLAGADLYVQSSRHEAAAVAVLEAAAAGLPVIGTCVGYVADWSPDLAEAIDEPTPQSLADGIRRLVADRERSLAMAAAAQSWVQEHDADWTAAQFEQLYQEAVGRR
jgi:glycosyltransferase involved in cell wall biosynthesis